MLGLDIQSCCRLLSCEADVRGTPTSHRQTMLKLCLLYFCSRLTFLKGILSFRMRSFYRADVCTPYSVIYSVKYLLKWTKYGVKSNRKGSSASLIDTNILSLHFCFTVFSCYIQVFCDYIQNPFNKCLLRPEQHISLKVWRGNKDCIKLYQTDPSLA